MDNLLYHTQKPQYFVTLKVTKPKLRLNFIPSHTRGAYSYLLLSTSIIKFWYLVFLGGNKWKTSIAKRKTRTARAKGTSQAHDNYQQYANWLSQLKWEHPRLSKFSRRMISMGTPLKLAKRFSHILACHMK